MEKLSRVEVIETHRWEAPELVVGNQLYPWKNQTVNLNNDIEAYQFMYIVGISDNDFLLKTIYLDAMSAVSRDEWKVDIDYRMVLSFSGTEHQFIKALRSCEQGSQIRKRKIHIRYKKSIFLSLWIHFRTIKFQTR